MKIHRFSTREQYPVVVHTIPEMSVKVECPPLHHQFLVATIHTREMCQELPIPLKIQIF